MHSSEEKPSFLVYCKVTGRPLRFARRTFRRNVPPKYRRVPLESLRHQRPAAAEYHHVMG